uniref:DUF5655 domain-containing protein n=1 Tax=Angiostrongylus cantonensis TaxID=6313 RepID=A0A0K0CWV4_ANGCA
MGRSLSKEVVDALANEFLHLRKVEPIRFVKISRSDIMGQCTSNEMALWFKFLFVKHRNMDHAAGEEYDTTAERYRTADAFSQTIAPFIQIAPPNGRYHRLSVTTVRLSTAIGSQSMFA